MPTSSRACATPSQNPSKQVSSDTPCGSLSVGEKIASTYTAPCAAARRA
jgi:hypothetical protein